MAETPRDSWCPIPPDPAAPQGRAQPGPDLHVAGTLCHAGWQPVLLTGLFRQLMVHHFSNPRNVLNYDLIAGAQPAVWRDGPSTGIVIESVTRWDAEKVGTRPAVIVKRNPYRNIRVSLGDYYGADRQGFDHYVTLWAGSHTLFCLHAGGAPCELLGSEVQRTLTTFAPAVRLRTGLLQLRVMEVGALVEVEEARQHVAVPVSIAWAYQETWQLRPDALPLRAVDLNVTYEHA